MSRNYFAISDTHFFHSNILKFVDDQGHRIRGQFPKAENDGIKAMHEYMVEKWNAVVQPSDYVYHLGDVTFDYSDRFNTLMSRLKGRKRFIVGNHDKIWNHNLMRWFEKADLWKGFQELGFTMSHLPLRLDSLRDGFCNVHGHTHQRKMSDPRYINVCVETRDYTPVNFDQIVTEIKAIT